MKKSLFSLAALLMLAGGATAQTLKPGQVPAAVVSTFKAKFPTVKTNTWEKEGDKYEAGFKLNGNTMSALLSPAGELLETETDMAPSQLPAAVRATLARDYKGVKVNEAAKIVAQTGDVKYEAEVREKGKNRDVLFTAEGRELPKK